MLRARQAFAAAGVLLLLFGAFRLLTEIPLSSLIGLAEWMVAAVIIHDGIIAPLVVGVGVVLHRLPPRGRRYLQWALIVAGLVTVIAIPLIARKDTQPSVKAILQRDYAGGLVLLLALIAGVALVRYLVRLTRDRLTSGRADRADSAAPEG